MKITLVHVHVKPEYIDAFIEASKMNTAGTLNETGNIAFEVLQSAEEPARFVLYEIFENEAAVQAHKETSHYLAWRETVADWMAEPRQGIHYKRHDP